MLDLPGLADDVPFLDDRVLRNEQSGLCNHARPACSGGSVDQSLWLARAVKDIHGASPRTLLVSLTGPLCENIRP